MRKMKNIHVIIATAEWHQDQLRYRRHRLAEFLQKKSDTEEVIWLCPTPRRTTDNFTTLKNGIKQWTIQDLFPQKVFRFGRYMDLFYKNKLTTFNQYINQIKKKNRLIVWFTFPGFPYIANGFHWDTIIYDCSDNWTNSISGKKSFVSYFRQKVIQKAEERIIDKAHRIFCTSQYLHDQVIQKIEHPSKSHIYTFENGVEFDLFREKKLPMKAILPDRFNGTVLGFIGGIKSKLDFELIQDVATKKSNWLFLFVGPDQTTENDGFHQLLNNKNVVWTGSIDPFDVPKYMQLIDIGIMPYKASSYNKAIFPLKLFEFLAAGKPAIGVHLPSTTKYVEQAVYNHLETNDSQAFIQACEKLECEKDCPEYIDRRIQVASGKNWNDIFEGMLQLV
ncbi:glycosyltransferase [Terrilactibacillus sp. BCM23-1]|uniref:Glycosyltransferase n=1 Tax=Terrilactibacillus tamarindi TaxID=2599694 RepID=A0A6N8CNX3_9BACI|nr:glycosyltransferase [Terrilactibacillus tamarindi]